MYTLADFVKYKLDTDKEFAELWIADHQSDSNDSEPFVEDVEEVEYDYDEADLWGDYFDVASPEEVEKTFGVKVKNKPFENDSDWVKPEWLVGKIPVLHSIGRIHHLLTWFDTEEEAEEFCEENEWEYKDDNDFVWELDIYPKIEDKNDAERFYYGVLGNPRPGSVTVTKKKSVGEAMNIGNIWCGSADIIDGHIEETHTYEEAEDNDFHHSLYFSPNVAEKITDGDSVFFFIDDGEIVLDPIGRGDDELKNERFLINQIKKQLNGKLVEAVSPEGYAPSKTGKALSEASKKPQWFTVMFFHNGNTHTGIISATDEKSARGKFNKYCPSCSIDRVKKGILGHDYPMITSSFEYDMGWQGDSDDEWLEYDDEVADSWKGIVDVATPEETEKAFGKKVSVKESNNSEPTVYVWYKRKFPDDYQLNSIDKKITFKDVYNAYKKSPNNHKVMSLLTAADAHEMDSAIVDRVVAQALKMYDKKSEQKSINFDINERYFDAYDSFDDAIYRGDNYTVTRTSSGIINVFQKEYQSGFRPKDNFKWLLVKQYDGEGAKEKALNFVKRNDIDESVKSGEKELTEAPVKYVDYKGQKSRLYSMSKKNKKTGEVKTRYFVKDKDYEPLQYSDTDINAGVPDRVKFIGYKQFKTLYNPNDPSTEQYKGKLFPLFVGAKQKDGIEIGKWYKCGTGELRIEVDSEGNPIPGGAIQVDSKLGNLAYRPGWHLSSAPVTRHIGVGQSRSDDDHNDYGAMYSENVWAKVEYSAHYDFTDKARQVPGADKDPKKAMFTDKSEFKNGFYHYRTNSNADDTEDWLIADAIRVVSVLSDDTVRKIANEHGLQAQDRWTADGTSGNAFVADFGQFSVVENLNRR